MMRRKISRLYGELRFLEDELETRREQKDSSSIIQRLDHLERQANQLRIPAAYASLVYVLRHHIDLVRQRLMAAPQATSPSS
jgi:uncharacterized protein